MSRDLLTLWNHWGLNRYARSFAEHGFELNLLPVLTTKDGESIILR